VIDIVPKICTLLRNNYQLGLKREKQHKKQFAEYNPLLLVQNRITQSCENVFGRMFLQFYEIKVKINI